MKTVLRLLVVLLLPALAGCSVAAAPCDIGSAVLGAIPIVGSVLDKPTEACGDVIDP